MERIRVLGYTQAGEGNCTRTSSSNGHRAREKLRVFEVVAREWNFRFMTTNTWKSTASSNFPLESARSTVGADPRFYDGAAMPICRAIRFPHKSQRQPTPVKSEVQGIVRRAVK